jgi:inhibitor of cysteine peptidase
MGDTLVIKLEGNPTTGYNWLVTSVDKAILEQQGEPVFKADSTLVGSGGMLTLTFKAIAAGTTNLQLGYMRSWETGVAPLQTYEVTIVVK